MDLKVNKSGEVIVRQGNLILLSSGSFLFNGSSAINLHLDYNNDRLNVVINFEENSDINGIRLETRGEKGDDTLYFTYYNINTESMLMSLGNGPFFLGTIADDQIWAAISVVSGIGTRNKQMNYTFWLEDR